MPICPKMPAGVTTATIPTLGCNQQVVRTPRAIGPRRSSEANPNIRIRFPQEKPRWGRRTPNRLAKRNSSKPRSTGKTPEDFPRYTYTFSTGETRSDLLSGTRRIPVPRGKTRGRKPHILRRSTHIYVVENVIENVVRLRRA